MSIPKNQFEGILVPLSNNININQVELKDIRPIVVMSDVSKILEKDIKAKGAILALRLL